MRYLEEVDLNPGYTLRLLVLKRLGQVCTRQTEMSQTQESKTFSPKMNATVLVLFYFQNSNSDIQFSNFS